jgi:hypothetical protein
MANTERPKHAIVNCETGVTELVDLTDEEIAQAEVARQQMLAERAEREALEEAKAEAKASAVAKLAALGLTEDEAKAIAG